jgi:hypothetical protein
MSLRSSILVALSLIEWHEVVKRCGRSIGARWPVDAAAIEINRAQVVCLVGLFDLRSGGRFAALAEQLRLAMPTLTFYLG